MSDGLTDGQLYGILGAIAAGGAAVGGVIRWSAGIVRDAMNDSKLAIRDNTAAFARLTEWLGRVDVRTETTSQRVVEIHHEISDVHEIPAQYQTHQAHSSVPSGNGDARDLAVDDRITPVEGPGPGLPIRPRKRDARAKTNPGNR